MLLMHIGVKKMQKNESIYGKSNVVGRRISLLRKKIGLNQQELSEEFSKRGITISTSAISKLENQTRKVTDIELIALAEILNTDIKDIMYGISK